MTKRKQTAGKPNYKARGRTARTEPQRPCTARSSHGGSRAFSVTIFAFLFLAALRAAGRPFRSARRARPGRPAADPAAPPVFHVESHGCPVSAPDPTAPRHVSAPPPAAPRRPLAMLSGSPVLHSFHSAPLRDTERTSPAACFFLEPRPPAPTAARPTGYVLNANDYQFVEKLWKTGGKAVENRAAGPSDSRKALLWCWFSTILPQSFHTFSTSFPQVFQKANGSAPPPKWLLHRVVGLYWCCSKRQGRYKPTTTVCYI